MRVPVWLTTSRMALVAVMGFVLMVAGFIGYVADPSGAFSRVFGIGVAVLVIGYGLLHMANRQACLEVVALEEEEDRDGYMYVMDPDHPPQGNDATITDMRGD